MLLPRSANELTVDAGHRARQALMVWALFIGAVVLINGTIPFVAGVDLHAWTYSPLKGVVFNLCVYGVLFLVLPLVLTKGWATARQPAFLVPLLVALLALTLSPFARPVAALSVVILAYLHWRFDLSDLGFRSRGLRGDAVAVILIGLLSATPALFRGIPRSFAPMDALVAGLDRLFANPASTVEYLFYFGFLAERLLPQTGRWWTPVLVGFMYMLHEMTNPEYWYEGLSFPIIFAGVALIGALYLWRRNVVAVWLGDGLGRFASRLFG